MNIEESPYGPHLHLGQMKNATHCVEMRMPELSSRRTAETSRIRRISEIGLSLTGSHSATIGLFTLCTLVVNSDMLFVFLVTEMVSHP